MRILITTCLFCIAVSLSAQPTDERYSWTVKGLSMEEALYELSELTGVPISFINSGMEPYQDLHFTFSQATIDEILNILLGQTGYHHEWLGRYVLIVRHAEKPKKRYTLSGYLRDAVSGEPLIAANVYTSDQLTGTSTNQYGYYCLTLTEGPEKVTFSFLGYKPLSLPLDLQSDQVINKELHPSLYLEEVLVTAPSFAPAFLNSSTGKHAFLQEDMDGLPSLNGEPDLLRLCYLLPGVQTGADGFGGLSVRGGDVDQNLILLDGVPVYNATHLLGVFSIFNSSAIRGAQLYKGAIPARFGGRISSVLDVRTKEGNSKEWVAEADMGLASGKVSLEGPLARDKSSVFLGVRRSFIDLYSRPFTRKLWDQRGGKGELGYYFFDVNAKVNYSLGHRDHLYASLYTGGDDFLNIQSLGSVVGDSSVLDQAEQTVNWGNAIGSIRWNHLFGSRLFSNTTLTYSRFFYGSLDEYDQQVFRRGQLLNRDYLYFRYNSNNRDLALATDFDFRPNANHTIRFGSNAVWHRFQPGAIFFDESQQTDSLSEESIRILLEREAQTSLEFDLYFEDEFQISGEFGGNVGMRATTLLVNGDLMFFAQPRLQLGFKPRSDLLVSLGVGRYVQPLHLLTNSGAGLPRDLWVSSTSRIRPVTSWQFTGAGAWTMGKAWTLSLEAYYKTMANLITFQEGLFTGIDATNWQNNVAVGEGWSYGAELLLKRQGPRLAGWLAYTLSNSRRRFEAVNVGESFPYQFDRRHSLHLVGAWAFSQKWKAVLSWTFGTGVATTLPRSSYQFNQFNLLYADQPRQFPFLVEVTNYGRRNDLRLPSYHRLDLEIQYAWENERFKHELSFGAYNAYNRFNPLYYILAERPDQAGQLKPQYLEVALFPFVPILRYRIEGLLGGRRLRW